MINEIDVLWPLVKEICATCGNRASEEKIWMMFSGTNVYARVPFHAAHTILETDQTRHDYDVKILHSYVKEKCFLISEQGVLADKIGHGVLKSLVTLQDKPNSPGCLLPAHGFGSCPFRESPDLHLFSNYHCC